MQNTDWGASTKKGHLYRRMKGHSFLIMGLASPSCILPSSEVVLLKGRAACEVDAADELVATELLFNGALGELDKHQLVALLSCLVPVEKSGEAIKLTQAMAGPLAQLQV